MPDDSTKTRVTILTGTYRIRGYVDLLPNARLTDYMTEAKDFIALTDVEVWEPTLGGRQVFAAPFLNLRRDHIQIIAPGH